MSWRTQRTDGGTIFPSGGGAPRADAPTDGAVGHARRRALQPDGPRPRQRAAGEGGAGRQARVPRRDRARTASTSSARFPAPIPPASSCCSARISTRGHRHRRDRQRRRRGGDDGSDAHPQDRRRANRGGRSASRCGAARRKGCSARAPTCAAHLADRKTMALKPEHQKIAAYFNLDNGTGRIRGVWMQGNLAVVPVLRLKYAAIFWCSGFSVIVLRSARAQRLGLRAEGLPPRRPTIRYGSSASGARRRS